MKEEVEGEVGIKYKERGRRRRWKRRKGGVRMESKKENKKSKRYLSGIE